MKAFVLTLLKKIPIFARLIELRSIEKFYLTPQGWTRSAALKKAVTQDNSPIPWLTYSFIEFIKSKDLSQINMAEYGSGTSTIWFSSRVNSILSIENNADWFDYVEQSIKKLPNASIILRENKEEYINAITEDSEKNYDLVLIDGRFRVDTALNSLNSLSHKGVLVLDNSSREQYQPIFKKMEDLNYNKIDFWGLSPGSVENNCTTVFYRHENALNI